MNSRNEIIERVFKEEQGKILASLIRILGDMDLAEEALQDALASALRTWPRNGSPESPGAWLTKVARNAALTRLRRDKSRARREDNTSLERPLAVTSDIEEELDRPCEDDRLRLVFTCCHPALDRESQIALTLRTLCGITTAEIARAFLLTQTTTAQRLVRAKKKIRDAGIPYRVPPSHLLAERLPSVLLVVYLIFNEGYAATSGEELIRSGLCQESVRLARLLRELMPDEPEVLGLLALLLLQDSRRQARTDAQGRPVLLEEQDRSRWDHALIQEGIEILDSAVSMGVPGPYQVQAAIAAEHARASRSEETQWDHIVLYYDTLLRMQATPIIALNRAAAVAMADGPEAGLSLMDQLAEDGDLVSYLYLHSSRAELLRRLGRRAEAEQAYERALSVATAPTEKNFLRARLSELLNQTDESDSSTKLT